MSTESDYYDEQARIDNYQRERWEEYRRHGQARDYQRTLGANRVGIMIGGPFDGKAVMVQRTQLDVLIPMINNLALMMWDPTGADPREASFQVARYDRQLIHGLPDTELVFYKYAGGN